MILTSIILTTFGSASLFFNITTFIPIHIKEYHPDVPATAVGLLISFSELTMLFGIPLAGQYVTKLGRKNMVCFAFFMFELSMLGFGLLSYVENDYLFMFFSYLLRIMQGVGASCNTTSNYSSVTLLFHKERTKYIGIYEGVVGMSFMLGPFLGMLFYS